MLIDSNLNDIIANLTDYIQLMNLEATGPVGEIVAQLILLTAFDHSTKEDQSEVCTVKQFLSTLFGSCPSKIPDTILNGIIFFNHFIERLNKLCFDDILQGFLARGAAGKFKKNYKTFDLFIPFVLQGNEVSFILIQVKNRVVFNQTMAEKVFKKMEIVDSDMFKDQTVLPFLSILMSLGDAHTNDPNTLENQLFFSFKNLTDSKIYSDDTLTSLRTLLNCERFDLTSTKYEVEVLKSLMIGSL